MPRYFLIGYMGCGKTTLGKPLAERLGIPFVDLDALIEQQEKCTIPALFEEVGESGFRIIEQAVLHTMLNYHDVVVATGGGAPCFFENMEWMNTFGTTIYLKTDPKLIHQRIAGQTSTRPLLNQFSKSELLPFIEGSIERRAPFYELAKIIVHQDTDNAGILEEILSKLPRK